MLTTNQAAAALNRPRVTILKWIERKQLYAERFGRDWQIPESEIERIKKLPRREVGRPKKIKPVIETTLTVRMGEKWYGELCMRELETYAPDAWLPNTELQEQYDHFKQAFEKPTKRQNRFVTVTLTPPTIAYLNYLTRDYNADAGWDMDEAFTSYFMRKYPKWAESLKRKL